MPKFYAGIGSRSTPNDVLDLMCQAAIVLHAQGWTLRSGGADGADMAFATGGVEDAHIYLPWPGFNDVPVEDAWSSCPSQWTHRVAAQHHPRWSDLTSAVRRLHARNVHQILGDSPQSKPSTFVMCWTPDGCSSGDTSRATGGTGQALRIAAAHHIPIFNLAVPEHRERVETWVAQASDDADLAAEHACCEQ